MTFNSDHYGKDWYEFLGRFDACLETALYSVFGFIGKPASFLDLGCGTGWLVKVCYNMGIVPSVGVELSPEVKSVYPDERTRLIITHDLRTPLDLKQTYDLVWCVEVAEHLPFESADVLCDTIVKHTGKWLIFTAAVTGQGGEQHINEQEPAFWREKLEERGLVYDEHISQHLQEAWWWTTGPCSWMPANLQVFHAAEKHE